MFRLLDRIEFLVGEALVALRRNTWMTFSAVNTVTVALYLLGALTYIYLGIQSYAAGLPSKFEMRVFLKDSIDPEEIRLAGENIQKIPGVKEVVWVPKEEAWEHQKLEMPDITDGIENPLPDALRVTLLDLSRSSAIVEQIKREPYIGEGGVAYFDEEHKLLAQGLTLIRQLGVILGGLMLLTSGILIYNTIRLTILSRQREMKIMNLIGATGSTIVMPLMIEGLIQGALGGTLAALLLSFSHMSLVHLLERFTVIGELSSFPTTQAVAILSIAGAFYGIFCSLFAVFESRRKL